MDKKPGVAEGLPAESGDFTYSERALTAQFKFMLGRLLTVVDASIADPLQNKAVKDLMTIEVWSRRDWITQTAMGRGAVGGSPTQNTA